MDGSDRHAPRKAIRLTPALFRNAGTAPVTLTERTPSALTEPRGVLRMTLLPAEALSGAGVGLGCLVRTRDGRTAAVRSARAAGGPAQAGAVDAWPYVAVADGGALDVALERGDRFERLLFYVDVAQGAADFRDPPAEAAFTAGPGRSWRVPLDSAASPAGACAVALLLPGPRGLELRREVRWYRPRWRTSYRRVLSRDYQFG
ncbi:tellurium resistance protein [Streptomyces sp. NPDC005012]|uniref:tellurium resistance protein n=1 Tax=unclassified Streptomyces TaxID=2593676 RepID=UPI0033A4C35A